MIVDVIRLCVSYEYKRSSFDHNIFLSNVWQKYVQYRTQTHIELFTYTRLKKTKKRSVTLKISVTIYNGMPSISILHIDHHSENGEVGACSFQNLFE